jgi:hypothetical protein
MTPPSFNYDIMGRTVRSHMPLLAPLASHENLGKHLTIIESESRIRRNPGEENGRTSLKAYSHRNYISYRNNGVIKMIYTNSKLFVECGVLADVKYQMVLMKTIIPVLGTMEHECHLHASAIALRERAVLILGNSGAGKSTTATLLEANGAEHLCDDVAPIVKKDDRIMVVSTGVGRMILPSIRKHIENEIEAIQIGEGYPVGNKNWYPAQYSTKNRVYPIVGVVVLTEEGGAFEAENASKNEMSLRVLLRSTFGPFDFNTYLAPSYLPLFGALTQQAHWIFERKPRSIDDMRLLANRIAEAYY